MGFDGETNDAQEEETLLERVCQGDQMAFKDLLQRHLPRVLRIAERMTGNATTAEDIAQEVMVRLWKKSQNWDLQGSASMRTWLYRVTINLCIDKSRERTLEPLEEFETVPEGKKEEYGEVHNRQVQVIIGQLLDTLSKPQRLVIILSYYEEMTAQEIADIMRLNANAVFALQHRGRKQLKAGLEKLGIEGWNNEQKS